MYVMQLHLYRSRSFPLYCGAFYERLAELYELPSVATLMKSLQDEVKWPGGSQVYYLENLREHSEETLFQIRFLAFAQGKDFTSIFLSIEESMVQNITIQFPARGDRAASSKMLEALKSVVQQLHMPPGDIPFEAAGFMEMGAIRPIREKRLSGFVWIEGLHRYLHISEDPTRVKEVQKRLTHL